jgi:hypothetical protein
MRMDIRTGKTYETLDAARADGVPESDIAEVDWPIVRFEAGPFKDRLYKRHPETGQLVRVKGPS